MTGIGHPYKRSFVRSVQDVLSISARMPSYIISGARWNIALKSNQDYSRIGCLCPVFVFEFSLGIERRSSANISGSYNDLTS